ncbi:MAG: phosphatase PAP2 family protein [Woeseiaceae bacterium]
MAMYEKAFNFDMKLCGFFNRACHYNFIKLFFSVISRLGNGVFWYALMLMLPLFYGIEAVLVVAQMLVAGLSGTLVYLYLKKRTKRARPYTVNGGIELGTQPLDQYSFPSGHTLHAIGFSMIVCYYYPEFIIFLVPVSILVAFSRMILGLHYPSDVLVGAGIGFTTAVTVLFLFN